MSVRPRATRLFAYRSSLAESIMCMIEYICLLILVMIYVPNSLTGSDYLCATAVYPSEYAYSIRCPLALDLPHQSHEKRIACNAFCSTRYVLPLNLPLQNSRRVSRLRSGYRESDSVVQYLFHNVLPIGLVIIPRHRSHISQLPDSIYRSCSSTVGVRTSIRMLAWPLRRHKYRNPRVWSTSPIDVKLHRLWT